MALALSLYDRKQEIVLILLLAAWLTRRLEH
jgi:hypothetical protein